MASSFFRVNKGVGLTAQAAAPSSPRDGEFYYDSTNGFQFRQSGSWSSLGGGGGGSNTPGLTTDASSGNLTVASGNTLFVPYLTVSSGDTYTINGRLLGFQTITVSGTLTVNGTVEYIS
jgi:hypothetical protein